MPFIGFSKKQIGEVNVLSTNTTTNTSNVSTFYSNISSIQINISTIESGKLSVPEYFLLHSSLTLFNTNADGRADTIVSTKQPLAEYSLKISSIGFYNTEQDFTLSTLVNSKLDKTLFNSNTSTIIGNNQNLVNRVSTIEDIKFDFLVHSTQVNTINVSNTILGNSLTAIETNKVDLITFNTAVSTFILVNNALTLRADDINNRKLNISTYNDTISSLDNKDNVLKLSISTIESTKLLSSNFNTNITRLDGTDSTINNNITFLSTSLNNRIQEVDVSISSIQSTIHSINDKITNDVNSGIESKVSINTFSTVTKTLLDVNTEQFSTLATKVVSTVQSLIDEQQKTAIDSKVSIIEYNSYKNLKDSDYISTISSFSGKDVGHSNKILAIDEYILTTLKTYEIDGPNGIYTYTGAFQNIINLFPPSSTSTVPNAPIITGVLPGNDSVTIEFSTTNTDTSITGYRITSSDGQIANGTSSPIIVSGLTSGLSYTFTIVAINANGNSVASGTSVSVVPFVTFTAVWGKWLDGIDSEFSSPNIIVTDDGNLYVIGSSATNLQSSITTIIGTKPNISGQAASTILKYNSFGTPQLGTYISGLSNNEIKNIKIDNSDNIYVVGYANSNFMGEIVTIIGSKPSSGTAGFLIKYNSLLIPQWGRWLDSTSNDLALSVAIDTVGSVYVCGISSGDMANLTTLMGSKPSNVNQGGFIIKYSSVGNPIWGKWLDGIGNDQVVTVATDSLNNVYIGGNATNNLQQSFINLFGSKPNTVNQGTFIIKFSSSGTELWGKWLDGNGVETTYSIAIDYLDNVYITGQATSSLQVVVPEIIGTKPSTSDGSFIIKYSTSGVVLAAVWLDEAGSDIIKSITSDSEGNVYVCGFSTGPLTILGTKPSSSLGAFIIKYNSSLVAQTGVWLDGPDSDVSTSIIVDKFNNIYVTGHTTNSLQTSLQTLMGSKPDNLSGAFLVKYNSSLVAQWGNWIDGPGIDFVFSVASDSNGNVYITGTTTAGYQSSLSLLLGPKPETTLGGFIINYNSTGNINWGNWIDGNNTDVITAVAKNANGNIYVVGFTLGNLQSSITDVIGTKPSLNEGGFVIIYNSLGSFINGYWLDGIGRDFINKIVFDSLGFMYLLGVSNDILPNNLANIMGPKPSIGNQGGFVLKYNSEGTIIWGNWIDGASSDNLSDIIVDTANNVYVVGEASAALQTSLASVMGPKPGSTTLGGFVLKYNSEGTIIWGNWIDGSIGSDSARSIAVDSLNNVYVTGQAGNELQIGLATLMGPKPATTNNGGFLIKYSPSGTAVWGKWIDSLTGNDRGNSVAVDRFNNIYVGGFIASELPTYISAIIGTKPSDTLNCAVILRFNSSGVFQGGSFLDSPGVDQAVSVKLDSVGNAYLYGTSAQNVSSYLPTLAGIMGSKPDNNSSGLFAIKYSMS